MSKDYYRLSRLQFDADQSPLREAIKQVCLDQQADIPFLIWLLENPQSPLPLPGQINLYNHDCLHALLGLGTSLPDEAFVIGFTMGTDRNTSTWHLKIFKFISRFLYPQKFQFCQSDWYFFDLGFAYGRSLNYESIYAIDFKKMENKTVTEIRNLLGINEVFAQFSLKLNWEVYHSPIMAKV